MAPHEDLSAPETSLTAAFLAGGRTLHVASTALFVLSSFRGGRVVALVGLALYLVETLYAVRVRIDEGLFRGGESTFPRLDALLIEWGLAKKPSGRTTTGRPTADRSKGALGLLKAQVAVVAAQAALLAASFLR